MSSKRTVTPPPAAAAVARRYRRVERPLTGAVAVGLGVVAAVAIVRLAVVPGLVAAAFVLVVARFPAVRSDGRVRLRSGADPGAVREDFAGACPPPLALQWGVADAIREAGDGATYEVSYLFGLRSVTVDVDAWPTDGGVELVVTTDGKPWGTYTASFERRGEGTAVTVEWTSDRRFGLRRLPQWVVAERYREATLSAQGYTVVDRDSRLGF